MEKISRKALKRPDAFMATTSDLLSWAQKNRSQVQLAVGGVVLLLVGIAAATTVVSQRGAQANEEMALGLAELRAEQWDAATRALNDVGERWGTDGIGGIARLFAAQAALGAQNADAAAAALESVDGRSQSNRALDQQVRLGLAAVAEQRGDAAKAAAEYAAAHALGGPYSAAAMLGEARCHEKLGNLTRARELYQGFASEFPTSGDQAFAAARMAVLPES